MRRRAFILIAVVYALSSFVAGPMDPSSASRVAHVRLGPIFLGRPITTWGDPPHYLVMVNSLIEDGDLDLRNNYDQARDGDWDVGTRFRGVDLDRHVETDRRGRELSFHSPFLPVLLAGVAWPFRGSEWVESVCIWFTLGVTLLGLSWCARLHGFEPSWLVVLALATPLWAYARDVWTEPYQAVAWGALLALETPAALVPITVAAVLFKYSFAIVPLGLGAVALWRGEVRRGRVLIASSVVALLIAFVTVQYLFRDADHFSIFHLGARHIQQANPMLGPFWIRSTGFVGLLLDPKNGLLPFCPFLVFGLRPLIKDARLGVPVLLFFLLHASYPGWRGGTGVSARYLIPMLPVLVYAVAQARPKGRLVASSVGYSGLLAGIAGILPVAAYDKSPWGIFSFLVQRLGLLFR